MQIATAAIIKRKGKYLVAKRKAGGVVGGKWEFPGGKLEKGESLKEALVREIDEELAIKVSVGKFFDEHSHKYKDRKIKLFAYTVSRFSGQIELRDHDEVRWVEIGDLKNMDFVGNDKPIIDKLSLGSKNGATKPFKGKSS